jgi:hypothetical protein
VNGIVLSIWTFLAVLPFQPFSYVPVIIARGGPGTWFLIAYLVYLGAGLGGFGVLSFLFYTVEVSEHSTLTSRGVTALGFALLNVGVTASCLLLAAAGIMGGYSASINNASVAETTSILNPFVYPITTAVLAAVVGAVVTMLALTTSKAPRS